MRKLRRWFNYYTKFIKYNIDFYGRSIFWLLTFGQPKAISFANDLCEWEDATPEQQEKLIQEWYDNGAIDPTDLI